MHGGWRRTLLIAIVAVSAYAGTATADVSRPRLTRPSDRPMSTTDQAKTLQLAIQGFSKPLILEARIGAPPRGTVHGSPRWLYFTIGVNRGYDYVLANWQVDVTTGLLRDLSESHGWPRVGGKTVNLVVRGGPQRWDGSSVVSDGFAGTVKLTSHETLRTTLEASCRSAGALLSRLTFDRPLGRTAVEVDVTVSNPARFLKDRSKIFWDIMRPIVHVRGGALAEGVLVVARNTTGRWIAASAYAVRQSSGGNTTNS